MNTLQFFPPPNARYSTADIVDAPSDTHTWTMKEKKDLWWTKWASIITVAMLPITGLWVAGHKDQQINDLQAQMAAVEKREDQYARQLAAIRETLDKMLLREKNDP